MGAGARARGLRGACALGVARAHRRAHQRAHRRRGLPNRQGRDAVVAGRRLRVAANGAGRRRRSAGRLRARVCRLAARHAVAHRATLRARGAAGGGGRAGDAVHGGGAVRGGRVAAATPARSRALTPPGPRPTASGAGAAVRRVLRAAVRRGGHPVPQRRASCVRAGGVLRTGVGCVVRAVRARRRTVARGGARRGAVCPAALAGHALVDVVRGARHVPAAGRVRAAHAGAAAGGAGVGADDGSQRGRGRRREVARPRRAARRRLMKRKQLHHRSLHWLSFLPNERSTS